MLSVRDVLKHYKLSIEKYMDKELRLHCPFHDDSNPSFDINEETGSWLCRSNCGGGGLPQLVMRLEKVNYNTAMLLLNNNFSLVVNNDLVALYSKLEELETIMESNTIDATILGIRKAFITNVLNSFKYIVNEHKIETCTWMKILIYIMADDDAYGFNVYEPLFMEFLQDVQQLKTM